MRVLLVLPGVIVMAAGGLFTVWSWVYTTGTIVVPYFFPGIGLLIFAAGVMLYGVGSSLGQRFWPHHDGS